MSILDDMPPLPERRKSLVHVPPAMGDILRSIADEMATPMPESEDPVEFVAMIHSYFSTMLGDSISIRNCAALLDRIAEENGGRPLRIERRQD